MNRGRSKYVISHPRHQHDDVNDGKVHTMTSHVMRSIALTVACILGSTVLTACGNGSTVTKDDSGATTTSQTSTSSSRSESSSSDSSSRRPPAHSKKSDSPSDATNNEPGSHGDETPVEVSKVPEHKPSLHNDGENRFLTTIKDARINIDGVAGDQVIASAMEYCQSKAAGQESFSVKAMAGQLVEQKLTDQPLEQVQRTITETADKELCGG